MIPRIAQDDQADYEGELCFVIGQDAKDVPVERGLEYIAAYTCGNDISSRKLQKDPKLAGGVPQWGFSKGFDTFAPLGPCLVRADLVGDPSRLLLKTIVDGEVRQKEQISDLLFDCAYLVSYLSSGTTLRKGSVVMTGTPGGTPLTLLSSSFSSVILTFVFRCREQDGAASVPRPGDEDGGFHKQDWYPEKRCQVRLSLARSVQHRIVFNEYSYIRNLSPW